MNRNHAAVHIRPSAFATPAMEIGETAG